MTKPPPGVTFQSDSLYDDDALHLALGLSQSTIDAARRDGLLQHVRRGNRTLYFGKWILEWLHGNDKTTRDGPRSPKGVGQ